MADSQDYSLENFKILIGIVRGPNKPRTREGIFNRAHNHNLCECQSRFDYAFYPELINAHRMPRFYPRLNKFCS